LKEQSLATRAVRGAFWTGGGLGVQMVVTLIFFRILNLEDMGYFTWAQRVVVLCALVGALGLNDALVKYQDASHQHFSSAFWACLLVGVMLSVGLIASERFLNFLIGQTESVTAFFKIAYPLALTIPVASISGIMRAMLARDLRFRAIAISEIVSVLIAAVIGLGLLIGDWGIESAIWNAIAREIALLGILWISAAWVPMLSFNWTKLKVLLPFGFNVSGANLLNYINNNMDKVYFVPVFLGPVATGMYAFAYQYTMVPLNRASVVLTRVIFPAFSKVQNDDAVLRRAYLRTVGIIALLAWPVLAGGFVYAEEVLLLVKGNEMLGVLNPLRLLIIAGMLKAVGTAVGSIFLAKGKANWSFWWTVLNLAVFVPALFYAVQFGLEGVARVVFGVAFLALLVTQWLVNRLIGLSFNAYFMMLIRPALIAVMVVIALLVCRPLMHATPLLAIVIGWVGGGVVYLLGIRLFAWSMVMRFWHDFRGQNSTP
jgi:O-antigen/teichoic acid export membrane protein